MSFTIAKGVRYLKIAKLDANGTDYSDSLQELEKIRIKYSDIGVVEYPVVDITEYPGYYLYRVNYTQPTSSLDNEFLDYYVSASILYDGILVGTPKVTGSYVVPWISIDPPFAQIDGNSLNYLKNTSTGLYNLGNTPNLKFDISRSANVTIVTTGSATGVFEVSSSINGIIDQFAFSTLGSGLSVQDIESNFQYNPINTEQLLFKFRVVAGNMTASVNSVGFLITQSRVTQSSTNDLVVIEPYFTSIFEGSDCDVTYGGVDEVLTNKYYFDVDYSNGLQPVNFGAIISGTAELATVNQYNYSARASTYPRYDGSQLFQANENKWTIGDKSFGKTPSIQTKIPFFAYFDWAQNVRPEIQEKTHFHIKYLIDEDGNVYNPSLDSPYYWNLVKALEDQEKVRLVLRGSEYVSPLINTQVYKVHRSGKRVQPIIYSQLKYEDIGNTVDVDYTSSITFVNSTGIIGNATDYSFLVSTTGTIPISGFSNTTSSFNTISIDQAGYWNLGTKTYTFTDIPSAPFDLAVQMGVSGVSGIISTKVNVRRNNIIIATLGNAVGSSSPIISAGIYTDFFENFAVSAGDKLTFEIVNNGPGSFNSKCNFQLFPQTLSSASISAPYWTTGSLSKNVLTGSGQMTGSLYGNPYMLQQDISGSGFDKMVNY
ncbi:MAG: hypothetical protein KC414_06555, partial [Romboutsia sp.]|nr:hypothetical protein [Romboutsia sp.]